MTYGETGGAIRAGLTMLLKQQRIQEHLGGPTRWTHGINPPATEREQYATQILRYRRIVLAWCHQATIATDPYLGADEFHNHHQTKRGDNPYDFLRLALGRAIESATTEPATPEELVASHELDVINHWRHVAQAAALGEHDFAAGLGNGLLTAEQSRTVTKDVAGIVQALVILDHRYARIPGWEKMRYGGWLGWTALAAGLEASVTPPDYTVDHRGWRPPLPFIRGPARPGLVGVLQAEQNLLVRLTGGTAPINLRLAVTSQITASADLASRTADVNLQARLKARAETYGLILQALRNVAGGHSAHGASAAREANNLINRISDLPADATPDPKMLAAFDRRFTAVDARIAELIEDGINDRTIGRRVVLPRLDTNSPGLIKRPRERVAPIEQTGDSDLLTLATTRLRPEPATLTPPPEAARSRADLYGAIVANADARIRNARPGTPRLDSARRPSM